MSDFQRDDVWQRQMRDKYLLPFYRMHSFEGRFVLLDKGRMATMLQRRLAVDTIAQSKGEIGKAVSVEEKIVRWPGYELTSFFLETQSCTVPGHESAGWMVYAESDYLAYGFAQEGEWIDLYWMPMQELKTWFWQHEAEFKLHVMRNTINKTAGRLVPIERVSEAIPSMKRFRLSGAML